MTTPKVTQMIACIECPFFTIPSYKLNSQ